MWAAPASAVNAFVFTITRLTEDYGATWAPPPDLPSKFDMPPARFERCPRAQQARQLSALFRRIAAFVAPTACREPCRRVHRRVPAAPARAPWATALRAFGGR